MRFGLQHGAAKRRQNVVRLSFVAAVCAPRFTRDQPVLAHLPHEAIEGAGAEDSPARGGPVDLVEKLDAGTRSAGERGCHGKRGWAHRQETARVVAGAELYSFGKYLHY